MGEITNSQKTVNIVRGYKPQFLAKPFQSFLPKTFARNQQEAKIIQKEIDIFLEKKAIKPIPHNQAKFVSNFFLVKKKSGGFRPVINLRNLNQFIHTEHPTLETITSPRTILLKDDGIVTRNICRCVSHYASGRGSHGLCSFPVSRSVLPISMHAFRPKRCCKGLHINHEASCSQSKSSGLQVSSIFRCLDSCCSNKASMSKTISVFSKFSPEDRLQNKLEKSSLTPSQIKEWLALSSIQGA